MHASTAAGLILCTALGAGCSRDLDLPSTNRLAVTADRTSLAPRDRTTLRATGGTGGYRFAFADGGQLSGSTAALAAGADPSTAAYQAGEAGSAQDEIEVQDSSGSTAVVRIAVTARLAATPAVSLVAPGGAVPLVVTGGKPDYRFALRADPTSDATVTPAGVYVAGSAGNLVDRVLVADATFSPEAVVTAEIHVGSPIDVYPPAITVAPAESVSFLAFGGAGSYSFSFGATGSTGPLLDPVTGLYVAGGNPGAAIVRDTVVVTDANGRTATATVTVGPALRVVLANTRFRPAVTVALSASGGKPPYVFGFGAKGNRTDGTVDAASGAYAPGWNVGASDLLQVTDATGSVAKLAFEPRPDAVRLQPGESSFDCVAHQIDASGHEAVLVPRATMSFAGAHDFYFGADAVARDANYPSFSWFTFSEAADTDRDTAYEVLVGSPGGLQEYDRGPDGLLAAGVGNAGYGGRPAALARPYAAAPKWWGRSLYGADACTINAQAGIVRFDWVDHAITQTCEQIAGGPIGSLAPGSILAMAAPDLDGNGYDDLVWYVSSPGPLSAGLRNGTGFYALRTLALPAGTTFAQDAGPKAFRAVPLPGTSARGLAALVNVQTAGGSRRKVMVAYLDAGGALRWTGWSPYDPNPTGALASGLAGFVPMGNLSPSILTWTGVDGVVSGFTYDAVAATTVLPLATLGQEAPFPVTCATVFRGYPNGGLNGLVDLYVGSSYSSAAEVSYGDADGRFGRTPRFLVTPPLALGDVDGDGLDDVVLATGTPGLRILYGTSEQLAQGPETATPTKPNVTVVGDFTGSGRGTIVYQDELGTAWFAVTDPDGTPAPPVAFTLQNPDGSAPTRLVSAWIPADLGGEAPGVDLFQDDGSSFGATIDAWIRYATTGMVHVATPAIPSGVNACRGLPLPAANGGGPAAVLVCEYFPAGGGHIMAIWTSALSGIGRARSFGPWTALVPAGGDLGIPAGNSYPQSAGTFGGRAWFATSVSGAPWLLEVVNGSPRPTATWRPLPLAGRAIVADLDGAGAPDVVVGSGQVVTRLLAQGTGTSITYQVAGSMQAPGVLFAAPRLGGTGATPLMLSAGAALDPVYFAIPLASGGGR